MILIVDDYLDTCHLLRRILKLHGYEAEWVLLGTAALHYLTQRKPGLVILDQMMPDMTGLEVLAKMRAEPGVYGYPDGSGVPVVMYSAAGDPGLAGKAQQLGACGWLMKGNADVAALMGEVKRCYRSGC